MRIRCNDLNVFYRVEGQGRPLIMLHGNGGSHRSFDRVVPVLRQRYRCFMPDTRWHGRTGKGEFALGYPQFGADLAAFVDALELERPLIVGYSDGGITALEYAARSRNVGGVLAIGANWDETGTTPEFLSYAQDVLRRARRCLWWPGNRRKIALMRLMTESAFYPRWSELEGVSCPVLLMTGDADVIPLAHTEKMAEAIPHARVCVVPACGHSVMKEQTEIFLKTAQEFFAECEDGASRTEKA